MENPPFAHVEPAAAREPARVPPLSATFVFQQSALVIQHAADAIGAPEGPKPPETWHVSCLARVEVYERMEAEQSCRGESR
jgi:hypothetical protein